MIRLVLIRHGESIYNAENRYAGHADVALTNRGIGQAMVAGQKLKEMGHKPDFVFSSDLVRAHETAKIALKELGCDLPIIIDENLRERNYGSFEHGIKAKIEAMYGKDFVEEVRHDFTKPAPNGQAIQDLHNNVDYFIEDFIEPLANHDDDKTVFIFSHFNTIRLILLSLEHISLENYWQTNILNAEPIEVLLKADFEFKYERKEYA